MDPLAILDVDALPARAALQKSDGRAWRRRSCAGRSPAT